MNRRRLMNEGPTVVGLLTSVLESGGSLDGAARVVAEEGPPLSRELFSDAVRSTDVKESPGIKEALIRETADLDREASGYRQAVMLCVCASESGDGKERLATLKEASDLALDATRIMGERYLESLTVPCTSVFALGILLPMIMMSIMPIMGIGGMFGEASIDGGLIAAMILVLVPVAILAISWAIRNGNPFIAPRPFMDDPRPSGLLLIPIPVLIALVHSGWALEDAIPVAVIPACAICVMMLYGDRMRSLKRSRVESGLRDSVFELGNALLTGDNFEKVSVEVLGSREECRDVAVSLGREIDICRGDVHRAISDAVSPVSQETSRALQDIYRCSLKDTEDAGGLALAVGRQYQNSDNIRNELDLRMKSMRDMMLGTAVFFAPLVLGMSISMLVPLSGISGFQTMQGMEAMASAYLVELSAMIAMMTSSLGSGGGFKEVVWRFSLMAPVALVVFASCSGLRLFRRDIGSAIATRRRCPLRSVASVQNTPCRPSA